MPLSTGSFSKSGSPTLKVIIKGPFTDGLEYEAILDTGFTGFLSIPLVEGIRLGLILYGATSVSFADGTQGSRLTARAMVKIQEANEIGVAILEPSSTEVLLGMGFLRLFAKAFFVSSDGVVLIDEAELKKLSQPNPSESSPDSNPPT